MAIVATATTFAVSVPPAIIPTTSKLYRSAFVTAGLNRRGNTHGRWLRILRGKRHAEEGDEENMHELHDVVECRDFGLVCSAVWIASDTVEDGHLKPAIAPIFIS